MEPSDPDSVALDDTIATKGEGRSETDVDALSSGPSLGSSVADATTDTSSSSILDSRPRRRSRIDGPMPATIGRFEVRERLGAGSMGVVYAAHDPVLDRSVAIKVIRVRATDGESEGTSRLLREAQALAKLAHPNVVSVYEVGHLDDQVYLVMELIRGVDLALWMTQSTRSWDQILEVYIEAGRGLAAAHAAGLIHRDFKPSNAIIGDDGRVRVLDFGLARARVLPDDDAVASSSPAGSVAGSAKSPVAGSAMSSASPSLAASASLNLRLTRTGALLGTPAFMAPEQFQGREVDAATDQFAFCVALYAALFGEAPFSGTTVLALCDAVCAGERPTPRPGPVPAHVVHAVLRGLSVDPAARWPSMELLLAELTHHSDAPSAAAVTVGHRGPQNRLRRRLAELRRGRGGVIMLEGAAGLGKSHLVRGLTNEAHAAGVRLLRGSASDRPFAAVYHALHALISDALGIGELSDPEDRRAHIDALFDQHQLDRERAPLLNDVLPLAYPESSLTRQLDPDVRADNLLVLLPDLLLRQLADGPALLVIEGAHGFDSGSWALVHALARLADRGPLLLLLTARPDPVPPPARVELLARAEVEVLRLEALSPEDSAALLAARLGLTRAPAALTRRAHAWTHGVPFYIEQLALALRDAGLVRDDARGAVVVASEPEFAAFQVPGSVTALLTSRLDRLPADALAALRVAAVLARPVAREELVTLLSRLERMIDGARAIEELLAAGLLSRAPPGSGLLSLEHALAQEATYAGLDPEGRQRLHQLIGSWYEEHVHEDSLDRLGALAHHWSRAGNDDKAVRYLGEAGERAHLAFASREVIAHLSEALARSARLPAPVPPEVRARWHRFLSEAHVKLGEYHAGRRHLAQALTSLGYRPPGVPLVVALAVLGHMLRQLVHRTVPPSLIRRRGDRGRRARDASQLYQAISEIAFFEQDPLHLTYGALAALNAAECSGESSELAITYSTAAILFGVLNLHGIARSYVDRARAAADADGAASTLAHTALLRSVYGQSVPVRRWMEDDIPRAIEHFSALGDRPRVHITLANEAFYRLIIEDLEGATRTSVSLSEHLDAASPQIQNFALVLALELDLCRGTPDLTRLDRLEALLQRTRLAHGDALLGEGVAAACRLRRGEQSHAQALAERVIARLTYKPPTTLYTSFGIRGALEVLLATDPHGAHQAIARAQRALRQIAFHNPAVRPTAALVAAQIAAARERREVTARRARRAAALARRDGLLRSEGRAQLLYASALSPGDPMRTPLLEAAESLLDRAGDTHTLLQLGRLRRA